MFYELTSLLMSLKIHMHCSISSSISMLEQLCVCDVGDGDESLGVEERTREHGISAHSLAYSTEQHGENAEYLLIP